MLRTPREPDLTNRMRWRAIDPSAPGGTWYPGWQGLHLTVREGRGRLALHVPGPFQLAILTDGVPQLFMDVVPHYWDCANYLRGRHVAPLPPWQSTDVRSASVEPLSNAWWDHWAKRTLRRAPKLLDSGVWWVLGQDASQPPAGGFASVTPYSAPAGVHGARNVLESRSGWTERGNPLRSAALITLRPPSQDTAGRVKWWRRIARDEVLPPAVALFVPLYDRHILLDGHDRLLAAVLEERPAPVLALCRVRPAPEPMPDDLQQHIDVGVFYPPFTKSRRYVSELNERLRMQHEPYTRPVLQARAYPGGGPRWIRDVQEAASLGAPTDHDVLEDLMMVSSWEQPIR